MTNLIGRFHNAETNEIIDRELTNEEFALLNDDKIEKKTENVKNDFGHRS
jgi:hypothetical protein